MGKGKNNEAGKAAGKGKERPIFPKRAVITAGMPYGNKELHFGHVGGMFVHADTFARFMRDRIGRENVLFVCGTDCYGSPALESYRKLRESGELGEDVTIQDYVKKNHLAQKKTLEDYEISLNFYGASALEPAREPHERESKELFDTLLERGYLKQMSTPQFYDPEFHVLLNGRQVVGKCPIEGCCSEKGYADECDLGHQYSPSELIDPKSALSGKTPELREVQNWYFSLENFTEAMQEYINDLRANTNTRKYILNTIEEFLKKPVIYVQKKLIAKAGEEVSGQKATGTEATEAEEMFQKGLVALEEAFPEHETIVEEKKASVTFVFRRLEDRDKAREVLGERQIFYRTGKTLVPFRLSGNIDWGVPVPARDGMEDLTFWVWPESLWAPISFTRTWLLEQGREEDEWKTWWQDEDSKVYQFIGEDNISFYGIAEMAMFAAAWEEQTGEKGIPVKPDWKKMPHLVANRHILFMEKKASSSSDIKPPMAKDLLEFYTPEQLRMHFLSLGLSTKSSSFKPQVYLPEQEREGVDPVLKEGNLLTNVFNRIVRSCLYALQDENKTSSKVPCLPVSEAILEASKDALLEYEQHMYRHDFHRITYVLDDYIRLLNKHYANNSKKAEEDKEFQKQLLSDCFYGIKTALLLVHPIAPTGCEMVRDYIGFSEQVFSWDHAFDSVESVLKHPEAPTKFLEPRVDFFKKPESQYHKA